MPTGKSTKVMVAKSLVVCKQCLECLAFPLRHLFCVLVRRSFLVGIVAEVRLEVVVVLCVVNVRSAYLSYKTVDNLIVETKESGEVGVATYNLDVVVEPCNRATIGDCTPCTILVTWSNPWCDKVELTYNLVGTTTCVC